MLKNTSEGEWVVIILSLIAAIFTTFSKPISESGTYIVGSFIGSIIVFLVIFYVVYFIITKLYPKSKDWGIILWFIAIVGISVALIFLLAIIVAFIFGMAGSSPTVTQSSQDITYHNFSETHTITPIPTLTFRPTITPIPTLTFIARPTIINSVGETGWVKYSNYKDRFSIYKPSNWEVSELDKSELMDKSDSMYSMMRDDFVYVLSPDSKGFIMIYGVDISGTLYSIFDDKEKTKISDSLYDSFISGIKQGETDTVKISSLQKDYNYYTINGNPARRVTVYMTMNGQPLSGDWYIIAHENIYYILGYAAMDGSTQVDSSAASNIMRTFATI